MRPNDVLTHIGGFPTPSKLHVQLILGKLATSFRLLPGDALSLTIVSLRKRHTSSSASMFTSAPPATSYPPAPSQTFSPPSATSLSADTVLVVKNVVLRIPDSPSFAPPQSSPLTPSHHQSLSSTNQTFRNRTTATPHSRTLRPSSSSSNLTPRGATTAPRNLSNQFLTGPSDSLSSFSSSSPSSRDPLTSMVPADLHLLLREMRRIWRGRLVPGDRALLDAFRERDVMTLTTTIRRVREMGMATMLKQQYDRKPPTTNAHSSS